MRAMVGVCLAGVLSLSLLACAHGPEKTVMKAESPKDANKSVKKEGAKDAVENENIGLNEALSSELLGSGPLENLFDDAEGFDAKMADAMAGEGDELVIGQGAGGMGMRGYGVGGGGDGFGRIHGLGSVDVKPTVTWMGSPTFSGLGAVDEEAVVGALGGGNMVMCQTLYFNDAPQEATEVKVQFTIGPNGQASDVTILNQGIEAQVSDCIAQQFGKMSFPSPQGGEVVVNAAMLFEP